MIYREIHLPGLHILTVEISGEFYKISTTYRENMFVNSLVLYETFTTMYTLSLFR
jgi:hypothetical protein